MTEICGYCGLPLVHIVIQFKTLKYHGEFGFYAGHLIRVNRDQNCWEQSDFGTISLCGQYVQAVMTLEENPYPN